MRKQRLIASPLMGEEWPILNNAVAVGSLAPAAKTAGPRRASRTIKRIRCIRRFKPVKQCSVGDETVSGKGARARMSQK